MVIENEKNAVFRVLNGFSQTGYIVKDIFKTNGLMGFYKGSAMAVIKSTLSAGLFFTCLESFSLQLKKYKVSGESNNSKVYY
jgi:hypothetical protein